MLEPGATALMKEPAEVNLRQALTIALMDTYFPPEKPITPPKSWYVQVW